MYSPFQADVSPLQPPLDHEQQRLSMPQNEATFQLDPRDNVMHVVEPAPADPLKAVREFVKKPKVSVKDVHRIMERHNLTGENQPRSRQTADPSHALERSFGTAYGGTAPAPRPAFNTNRNQSNSRNQVIAQIGADRKAKLSFELQRHQIRIQEAMNTENLGGTDDLRGMRRADPQTAKIDVIGGVDSLSQDYHGVVDPNNQFSGYFGRKTTSGAGTMRFKAKASPVQTMHEFPNMSAFAILDRRAEARRENMSKSKSTLKDITRQKEKRQYESYMSNVNTLNHMKKIFQDLCPVLEGKEAQEKEQGKKMLVKARSMRADTKRRNQSKEGTAAMAKKKKNKMIKCILNYERDLKSFEAAWSAQQPPSEQASGRDSRRRGPAIVVNQAFGVGNSSAYNDDAGAFSWAQDSQVATQHAPADNQDRYASGSNFIR